MIRRVITAIAAMLAGSAVVAQTMAEPEVTEYPRYTVEVIIFEYAEEISVGTERFLPDEPPLPDLDEPDDTDLVFGDAGTVPATEPEPYPGSDPGVSEQQAESTESEIVLHVEDEFTLTDIAGMLERLDVYRPIMHFAWTQVTRPEEETQPIQLRELAPPPAGLDGRFTLYLSRYLHLVVDLSLEQQTDPAGPVAIDDTVSVFQDSRGDVTYEKPQLPVRYRISEDRIFKSGDLRYFDHPRFGVLARITRVEETEDGQTDSGLAGEFGQ